MRLYIIRHAAAEQRNYDKDFQRVLRRKGHLQLGKMSRFLKKNSTSSLSVHISSSSRTRETYNGIEAALGKNTASYHDELYHASLQDLLDFIWSINLSQTDLAIIGHNPGLSALVTYFTGDENHLKTGGMVIVDFPFESTEELSKDCGEIIEKFRWG
jgi:phosphohistidine phosphatase